VYNFVCPLKDSKITTKAQTLEIQTENWKNIIIVIKNEMLGMYLNRLYRDCTRNLYSIMYMPDSQQYP